MFKTIEAICDNGKLVPIRSKFPLAAGGTLKSFKGDAVKYQLTLREVFP
jgi:hypothetical protein